MADLSTLSDAQLDQLISQHQAPSLSKMSDADLEKAIASHPDNGPGTTEDLSRAAVDGLTFGLGDKAAAGVRTLFNNPDNKSYADNLKYEMGQTQNAMDRQGGYGLAANVAGGLPLLAIPGGGEAAEGANALKLLNLLKNGAKTGALYGAASGAGHTDSLENLPTDTLKGAVVGGALGGVAAPVLDAAIPAVTKAAGAVAKLPGRVIGDIDNADFSRAYEAGRMGNEAIGDISPGPAFRQGLSGNTDLASPGPNGLKAKMENAILDSTTEDPNIDSAYIDKARKEASNASTAIENNDVNRGLLSRIIRGPGEGKDAINYISKGSSVNKGQPGYNPVLENLDTGDNSEIPYQLAGINMRNWLPHSTIGGIGELAGAAGIAVPGPHTIPGLMIAATGSPRLNAYGAYGLGATARGISKLPGAGNQLQNLANLLSMQYGRKNDGQ